MFNIFFVGKGKGDAQKINGVAAILAVDEFGCIGNSSTNSLPWKPSDHKEDMRHFKETTFGGTVIMGAKTFYSLGCRPLAARINIIVSSKLYKKFCSRKRNTRKNTSFDIWKYYVAGDFPNSYFVCPTFEEALELAPKVNPFGGVFVIGGLSLYTYTLAHGYIDTVIMSTIDEHKSTPKGDVFFPMQLLEKLNFVASKLPKKLNENITVTTYTRKER